TEGNTDVTRIMRDVKTKILKNDEIKKYFLRAVDDKVDDIIDAFSEIPIKNSNDLKQVTKSLPELNKSVNEFQSSVNRLIYKGKKDSERKEALLELQNILEKIEELDASDFKELTTDEFLDAKDVLMKITDTLFKLKQEMNK
ncbi:chromosome partitioning protein ParB, partial [Listeria monocytogenes]|nr:chromosome partitioning protein ParB [Listeria monocytogenes]